MVAKAYDWQNGALLEDHTRRKLKILREYFRQYVTVRCQNAHQTKFRLAVVDGFAGGGRYGCGTAGSPLIFIEELGAALDALNVHRAANGMPLLEIECLLVFNDAEPPTVALLRQNCAPVLAAANANARLHVQAHFLTKTFEASYPEIRKLLEAGRFRNVLYNLDQCGHSGIERSTILDIMQSSPSVEVFYTFSIESLLAFLPKADPAKFQAQLRFLNVSAADLADIEGNVGKNAWLGAAERIVFSALGPCAPYVSPFSINNPDGWRYWLIHFAKSYRAREVYNDILHDNASLQAHFGRSGLNMLHYDPSHDENALYLFDVDGRKAALDQLRDDIPRLLVDTGDAMNVGEFYAGIYNTTPAHSADVREAMIVSEDIEVLTPNGNPRRRAGTIEIGDVVRVKPQRSFFPVFAKRPKTC